MNRRLTILSVAYPFAPVGPDSVGGAEQVLHQLDRQLVGAGHCSLVVACGGSHVAGEPIVTPSACGPLTPGLCQRIRQHHALLIEDTLRQNKIDLVHLHGIDFLEYLPPAGVPALVTLHLPPSWYPQEAFQLDRPDTWLCCVSASQARACPPSPNLVQVVENGVADELFEFSCRKRPFALALGRICPEKNFHVALDAARIAKLPLALAGQVFPYPDHERYFREEIAPRLDRNRRFIGPVGLQRKRRLLAAARCLLIPSLAPETSSLVAMEAMACGTPVIAFPSGALPEIVEHGKTGFIVHSVEEMAEAIGGIDRLDPGICRHVALGRFSARRMVAQYLDLYRVLTHGPETQRVRSEPISTARISDSPQPRETIDRPAPLEIDRITTDSALKRITNDWHDLWAHAPRATPFQSPAWLIPWWRHIGQGELRLLAAWQPESARSRRRLAGILPLYIYPNPKTGERHLFPLGIATTDYLDLLAAPEFEQACLRGMFEHIAADEDWDVCELPQIPGDSALCCARGPRELWSQIVESEPCPGLDLPSASGGLAGVVPNSMLQNIAYYRRRAAKAGRVEIEQADDRNLDELTNALFDLHAARWTVRGQGGVLDARSVQNAHRESIPLLHKSGVLRLYALRIDRRIVAVFYGLADSPAVPDRRSYYYLGGFDPNYSSVSPGTLLIAHAIEQAIAEGAKHIDFLRGREPYKYLWGAKDRPTFCRRLSRASARSAKPVLVAAPGAGGGA